MDAARPPIDAVRAAVARALAEDLTPLGDLTSSLLPAGATATAAFAARAPGVIAGVDCATEVFAQIDETVVVQWQVSDGHHVDGKDVLGSVSGPLASILTAERTALNFLGHLSGIATLTRQYVRAAATGGEVRIWDTRKTTPGLRTLEKAAVRAGGGVNHRGNLSDWILLKDNHLALTGIGEAVARARALWPARTVHVECDRAEQVQAALAAGADALLLDNMTPDEVRACVALADAHVAANGGRRPLLEVSGGVNLDTVASYAATGVDLISVGAITNSAPNLDIGLDIDGSGAPAPRKDEVSS
jgi:nicotinate-nucleotide pyrophosphorylase (carboxylating)